MALSLTNQRALGLAISATFVLIAFSDVPKVDAVTAEPLRFGFDAGAVAPLTSAGIKPDYGSLWVGVWLQRSEWSGVDAQLDRLYAAGVTPLIHFYYWGNDITRSCLENGCWSNIHNAWKDRAGWQRLAADLVAHLNGHLKGRTAIIVLETEFNKNDVANYEPLDGYLSEKAGYFQWAYPAAQAALGFGNWGSSGWGLFDRAAATAKLVGLQGMRASTRDSAQTYTGLVASLLTGVQTLAAKFHKRVLVTDLGLSSYWEPQWLGQQKTALKSLADRRGEFKAAGTVGIAYRALYDAPGATTNEYYGEAERHFGLAWAVNKTWKPGMSVWAGAMRAERAAPSGAPIGSTVAVEAERFAQKSVGGWVNSAAASGGAFWNLWSNGYIAQATYLGAGSYDVRIRAAGMPLGGVAPLMKVDVDGREIWRGGAAGLSFKDYVGKVTLVAGSHTIRISFLNDAKYAAEDRNLFVDRAALVRTA